MKKVFVLLLALMMVGFVFAEEAKPAYTVAADTTLTWGYDLETQKHGFLNESSFSLTFPIAEGASATKGGDANVYGEISISDINFSLVDEQGEDPQQYFSNEDADGNSFDISAKIVMGSAYVTIFSAPDLSYDNAAFEDLYSEDDGYEDDSVLFPELTTNGGFAVGYKFGEMAEVALNVASFGDWGDTAATAAGADSYLLTTTSAPIVLTAVSTTYYQTVIVGSAISVGAAYGVGTIPAGTTLFVKTAGAAATAGSAHDKYAFGIDVTLTPMDMLALEFGAFYGDDGVMADPMLGLTLQATVKPVAGLEIVAAMDGKNTDEFRWDASGKIAYSMNEDKDTIAVTTYFVPKDTLGGLNSLLNLGLTFTDAEGFVPGLEAGLGFYAYDLLADPANDPMMMSIGQTLSYKAMLGEVNYVKPYQELRYDFLTEATYLNLGVEFQLFANTVFTADLELGATADDSNFKLVDTDMADAGLFTFACTISL